jgi:protein-S-isoprenylcysteine O-methyltransferase Ste14
LSWILAVVIGIGVVFTESLWERVPVVASVLFALGVVLVGIASIGRLWCTLYIAGRKAETLVTEGPYSICRMRSGLSVSLRFLMS